MENGRLGGAIDFPGRLIELLLFVPVVVFCRHVFLLIGHPDILGKIGKFGGVIGMATLICIGVLPGYVRQVKVQNGHPGSMINNVFPVRMAAIENRDRSLRFTSSLERITSQTNQSRQWPIILESYDAWDYEPIVSLTRFFAHYRVSNPLFLRLHGYPDSSAADFAHGTLGRELAEAAEKGRWGIRPWSEFASAKERAADNCFSTGLKGPPSPGCTSLGIDY